VAIRRPHDNGIGSFDFRSGFGGAGVFAATVVNGTVGYGNLRVALERGHDISDAVKAIFGGELPEETSGRKDASCR
jgi:hypothetical protein